MFEWITEIEEPPFRFNDENGELRFESIDSKVELNEVSPVCLLFASFDVVLDEDSLTSLPTPNEKAIDIILNEVVPHYLDVKQVFIDGKLKEINVRYLKNESKRIIRNLLSNGIYPLIPDLFRTRNSNLATYPRVLKYYSINKELIRQLHIEETNKIRDFLCSSFFANTGSISLQPTGGVLEDNLKESVTIRTFSTFADQIVLIVNDKDKSVVGLDIYG
ncbi:hypothetical protein V7157_10795 [Neobacillus drentensis]|uniref:hypothetical protein n=1 Tax=Neobacillus drentensis TaxID=220684 RepID=UPI002FFFAC45